MSAKVSKYHLQYESPCGMLRIESNGTGITNITRLQDSSDREDHPDKICNQALRELQEYFKGERNAFDVSLDISAGTPFQQSVWQGLIDIPFGKTITYGALANILNNPKAVRAVGTANGKNPILIIIPCHRVIGSDGSLIGFSAGLDMKKDLLSLESGNEVGVQASLF